MVAFSLRGHRCLDLLPCRRRSGVAYRREPPEPIPTGTDTAPLSHLDTATSRRPHSVLHAAVARPLLQMCSDLFQPERPGDPQRPRERLAALREIDAGRVRVHVGAPALHSAADIRKELATDHDDTQQARPRHPASTTDTGTNRSRVPRWPLLGIRLLGIRVRCTGFRCTGGSHPGSRLRTARHDKSIPLRPESGRPWRRTSAGHPRIRCAGACCPRSAARHAPRPPRCRSGCRSATR